MNAISALQLLTEGNARFAAGRMIHPHTDADRRAEVAREGQHPFATVLTCADSRVPAEIVFDRGIGDIFVVCVAGNVVGPSELGSVEYAVDHLATPVVLVLGHSLCGAVQATLSGGDPSGNLQPIVSQIASVAQVVRREEPSLAGEALANRVIRDNAWLSVERLLTQSEAVRAAVREEGLLLAAAVYDLVSGHVEVFGPHPRQAELIAQL